MGEPKMVAALVDRNGVRSERHGIYRWGDLSLGTPCILPHEGRWAPKSKTDRYVEHLLVEADPPAPDLTVTLPAEQVNWILESRWWSIDWGKLASIIRAAKDAQEA